MATPRVDWADLREKLWERSRGRCEVSGIPLDRDTFDAHHRRNKGMGGTTRPDRDAIWNLLALDPTVHNGGPRSVHGRRAWSESRGFLVPKGVGNVQVWPIFWHLKLWVYLTPEGGYRPYGPM